MTSRAKNGLPPSGGGRPAPSTSPPASTMSASSDRRSASSSSPRRARWMPVPASSPTTSSSGWSSSTSVSRYAPTTRARVVRSSRATNDSSRRDGLSAQCRSSITTIRGSSRVACAQDGADRLEHAEPVAETSSSTTGVASRKQGRELVGAGPDPVDQPGVAVDQVAQHLGPRPEGGSAVAVPARGPRRGAGPTPRVASSTSVVLPMPASPATRASRPTPADVPSAAATSSARSSSRPTNTPRSVAHDPGRGARPLG